MTTVVHTEHQERPLAGESSGPGPTTTGTGPANVALDVEGEGILRITLRPGSQVTAADGTSVRERFLTLTGGAACAVLLQVTGVRHVSRDAVRVFSEAVTVTAFAILGSTSVDRVIAHGRRGLPPPQCPSRYFTDEQEALAWLRTVNTSACEVQVSGQEPVSWGPA